MRDPEYRDLLHGRVPVQHFFDFPAGDVLAACLDHVLLAVDDVQQPEVVVVAEVSGVKPSAAEGLRRPDRVVEVAQHQVRAAVGDLADGPGGTGVSVSSRIVVSTLMRGPPRGARVCLLLCGAQCAGQRRHLRLAVEVPQLQVRQPLTNLVQDLGRHRRGAVVALAQAGQVNLVEHRVSAAGRSRPSAGQSNWSTS